MNDRIERTQAAKSKLRIKDLLLARAEFHISDFAAVIAIDMKLIPSGIVEKACCSKRELRQSKQCKTSPSEV
jgi:hypothetical protein